jgi:hypothetical protein
MILHEDVNRSARDPSKLYASAADSHLTEIAIHSLK